MSAEWGDLERRLRDLGSDIGGAPLPGPDAARHRARQRTRRQVAGAAAGIAAAAFGVIALGGLGPLSTSPPEPAHTPTPVPSPTEDAVEPGGELALTVEDLEASSGADELVGWQQVDGPPGEPFLCAPTPGDADQVIERWFQPSPDGYLHQIIEISTADAAQTRFDSVIDELLSCVEKRNADSPDDNWLSAVWTVDGIGDSAWLGEYMVEPRSAADELMVVQVNVVLAGDTVTIITRGGPSMEGHNVGPLPYDVATVAAERLCTWAGQDCTADPDPQQVYPPVNTDVEPGWLSIEDVVSAMPYFGSINTVDAIEDAHGVHVCFEAAGDPSAGGAASFQTRSYSDNRDTSLEIVVTQQVFQFESADAAQAYYAALVDSLEVCSGEQAGEVAGGGYEGVTWINTAEFATFHLGVVVHDSAVSILTAGQPSSAQDELPADQTLALLDRAGARLGDLE